MANIEKLINETDRVRKSKLSFTPGNEWQDNLKRNADGGVKTRSVVNAKIYITNDPLLKNLIAFDEFRETIVKRKEISELVIKKGVWSDSDDTAIRVYLESKYSVLFSKESISDAVVSVARDHSFNTVKERIESVTWDRKPRAERYFIDYLGAENNEYTRAITKIWLTGAVARAYEPGVKFEIVPILTGKQGIGKSTCIKNLYPDKFSDTLKGLGKSKDDYQQLAGVWLIELGELSAMKSTDIDNVKNFISAQKDDYRESYSRYSTPHLRKCVFIGSTNNTGFLGDATGERRFYPINCGVNEPTKDVIKPDKDDILQILAEAKSWYDGHEPLTPDTETLAESKKYQEDAKLTDPIKEAIDDFLDTPVPTNWDELTPSLKKSWVKYDINDLDPMLKAKYAPTTTQLTKVFTSEIMDIVFDTVPGNYTARKADHLSKRIRLALDNNENWEYSKQVIINGNRRRGYIRKDF